MNEEIADAIEVLVHFAAINNINDEKVDRAAAKVEQYLATYSPRR